MVISLTLYGDIFIFHPYRISDLHFMSGNVAKGGLFCLATNFKIPKVEFDDYQYFLID